MATSNRIAVGNTWHKDIGILVNESVSFTSAVGDQSSFRSVPAGKVWRLQTVRGLNGEAAARNMEIIITDQDGTTHAVLTKSGLSPLNVAASPGQLGWDGEIFVPANWRIYVKWYAMAGGSTCNWQYTAYEYDAI